MNVNKKHKTNHFNYEWELEFFFFFNIKGKCVCLLYRDTLLIFKNWKLKKA